MAKTMPMSAAMDTVILKIQRRLAVGLHGGDFVLLDLPDQQRAKNVPKGDDKAGQRA